jgi:chemotaxis protein methyltransferase CheR
MLTDADCMALLQWALPQLRLRSAGYRNVRGQVCKRIRRRLAELGLTDAGAYRARLLAEPAEWQVLDRLCVVTVSRFYRDPQLWNALCDEVLPSAAEAALMAHESSLRCWSIGCASGEEPYTLSIAWALGLAQRYPGLHLRVIATDVDGKVLARARAGQYAAATLRDLPAPWLEQAFDRRGELFVLREPLRAAVELRRQDVRESLPEGEFRIVLCRNMVFTYFDDTLQRATLERLLPKLSEGGVLAIGRDERLPPGAALESWQPELGIYRTGRTLCPADGLA